MKQYGHEDGGLEQLCDALLQLHNQDECRRFLVDLCSVQELNAMGQRLEVAQMLSEGMIYSRIVQQTGASSATISRVSRALQSTDGGIRMVLERMEEGD